MMDWRRGSRKKIMALYLYILVSWYVETDTIGAIVNFIEDIVISLEMKRVKFHF